MEEERRRQAGARRLGEHPGDVVEGRDPVEAEVAPPGVDGVVDDARQPVLLLLVGDLRAVPAHLPPHQRVGGRPHRVGVGRHVHARSVRAHLVMVDVGLRGPVAKEDLRPVARLDRVLHERVAVVVVPDVVVVQRRRAQPLVLGADRLVVPIRDDDLAVGVEAGDHDRDGVVEDAAHLRVVARGHLVDDLRCRLARRHLGGVQPVGLDDDRPAVRDRRVDLLLRGAAGVAEDGVHALKLVELRKVVRRGHPDGKEGVAQRRRSHVHDADAGALPIEELIVLHQLVPPGEVPVGPHLEAEEGLGRRDLLGEGRAGAGDERGQDRQKERRCAVAGSHRASPGCGRAGSGFDAP